MVRRPRMLSAVATTAVVLVALPGCGSGVPQLEPYEPPVWGEDLTPYQFGPVQLDFPAGEDTGWYDLPADLVPDLEQRVRPEDEFYAAGTDGETIREVEGVFVVVDHPPLQTSAAVAAESMAIASNNASLGWDDEDVVEVGEQDWDGADEAYVVYGTLGSGLESVETTVLTLALGDTVVTAWSAGGDRYDAPHEFLRTLRVAHDDGLPTRLPEDLPVPAVPPQDESVGVAPAPTETSR